MIVRSFPFDCNRDDLLQDSKFHMHSYDNHMDRILKESEEEIEEILLAYLSSGVPVRDIRVMTNEHLRYHCNEDFHVSVEFVTVPQE